MNVAALARDHTDMFRIKKLDIFIAKQFGLLFVATFFVCQFVLMMQSLWLFIDDLIGKGLSVEVLAKFMWYMGLNLVPQALPLAILLSSLIAYGNLGESSELTAIKAAGISLLQSMRSLIVIVLMIAGLSFYFQNVIRPSANQQFYQLLLSMRHKSPEVEIPEGVFYQGIPNTNLYVQKKDLTTGMLYGIMIYRLTGSYEDQAIILADSGMLQSTAEKKHLLLTLYSGEWNENMRSQDLGSSAAVPYRRETFATRRILLDFDGGLNMVDGSGIASDARSKSLRKISHDLDSIREYNDSVGRQFYAEAQRSTFRKTEIGSEDSLKAIAEAKAGKVDIDSAFAKLTDREKQFAVKSAMESARIESNSLEMKGDYAYSLTRQERTHISEGVNKFTLTLSCIIFFFIGAPLGAIIRKGGLGVPVIVSVLVFIVYYIFENSGTRMYRDDNWVVWFGKGISTMVLTPLAIFFTYKANNDSVMFNMDFYKSLFYRMFGIRQKRHIFRKEVIITPPAYAADAEQLAAITQAVTDYTKEHNLLRWPNPIKVFFREGDDQRIEEISQQLELVIEDLSNTKDKQVLHELNQYPVLATRAHTRPFRRRWLNAIAGLILPLGLFFYIRMLRFRLRLYNDLRTTRRTNANLINRIGELIS